MDEDDPQDELEPYEVDLTRAARRALAEQLPVDAAVGVADFLIGPLAENPHRVGKELDSPLNGVYSARVMREWRVLYLIDEEERRVSVRSIGHCRDAYRMRTTGRMPTRMSLSRANPACADGVTPATGDG